MHIEGVAKLNARSPVNLSFVRRNLSLVFELVLRCVGLFDYEVRLRSMVCKLGVRIVFNPILNGLPVKLC